MANIQTSRPKWRHRLLASLFSARALKWVALLALGLFIYLIYPSFGLGQYLDREALLRGDQPTRVLDREGRVLSELFIHRYGTLKAGDIPRKCEDFLLFVEDDGFHDHFGFSPLSILRAFFVNLFSFEIRQGGSTLTQQLARLLLNDRRRSLQRKVTELSLALILEFYLSKREILAMYMNRVYLGHGAYGFQNAARFYFQKDLSALNDFETILLVSLPAAPNGYSPLKHTNRSFRRTRAIIDSMLADSASPLTVGPREVYRQLSEFYGKLNRSPNETFFGKFSSQFPTVTEYVRDWMLRRFGNEAIYREGYTVHTTLDRDMLTATENITEKYIARRDKNLRPRMAVPEDKKAKAKFYKKLKATRVERKIKERAHLAELAGLLTGSPVTGLRYQKKQKAAPATGILSQDNRLQVAVTGLDVSTGNILFVKGSAGFSAGNQFNRAFFAYRQTGSSIKPIIYSSAIASKTLTAASILNDSPVFFEDSIQGKKDWLPENYDYQYAGPVTVRDALARSINIPAILAAQKTGFDNLAFYYKKFFFPTEKEFKKRWDPVLSIAIGSLEFSTLEMALAYSAFPRGGTIAPPRMIQKISDRSGKTILENPPDLPFIYQGKTRRVFSPEVARIMVSLTRGSGRRSKAYNGGLKGPMGGKTGTSNHYKDAWFAGYTPDVVMAVWVGYDNPAFSMGPAGNGTGMASLLWGKIMAAVQKTIPEPGKSFQVGGKDIVYRTICRKTGYLAGKSCPSKYRRREIFLKSRVPAMTCYSQDPSHTGGGAVGQYVAPQFD